MAKRKPSHTRWMVGTILGGVMVSVGLIGLLHHQGVERIFIDQGGFGFVRVRPLPGPNWRTPPGTIYQLCGVTDWGTHFTDIRQSYRRRSGEVLEDNVYFLWH